MRKLLFTAITSAVLLLVPSFSQAQESNSEVTGTVAYRERVALPPDAVINVQLLDTSIADIAAQTVADVMINGEGRQVPVPFTLSYDPAKIVPGNRYSVRATIRSGDGMLLFSTTQSYPVLTRGAPSKVNLILYRVGHGAKRVPAAKKPAANSPAEPQTVAEAASEKPAEPASVSETTQPTATSSTGDSEKTTQPSAAASATNATSDNPETSGQQIVVEPAAAANTELTIPGSVPQSKDAAAPPAPDASSPATTAESAPAQTETAPTAATDQQAPSAQAPPAAAPEASTPTESRPAEEPATTAEQAPTTESKTEPAAPSPEGKAAESEPPLPEAPSASKGIESTPSAPPEGSDSDSDAESSSRPERPMPATALTPLANTQWKLVQLNGQDVFIASTQKPVTLAFSPEGRRIAGSAGCNSFLGTYSEERGVLQMHPGNMTMMFCPDPAGSREKKFIAMLRTVDGYRLTGDFLALTSNGKTVAKFKTNSPL